MFCSKCGNALNDQSHFCTVCGAAQRRETNVHVVPGHSDTMQTTTKKRKGGMMVLPVAVLLVLLGLGSMVLSAIGKPTTALTTGYEQVYIENNDDATRDARRYKVTYAFNVNGERYTGSVTRIFEGASYMRETMKVRYLPFWPHYNVEDNNKTGIGGLVVAGTGVFLIVIWARQKSGRRYRGSG